MKRGLVIGTLCLSLILIISLSVVSAGLGDFFKKVFGVGDRGVMYSSPSGIVYSEDFESYDDGEFPSGWGEYIQGNEGEIKIRSSTGDLSKELRVHAGGGQTIAQTPKIKIDATKKYKLTNLLKITRRFGTFYIQIYCFDSNGVSLNINRNIPNGQYTYTIDHYINEIYEFTPGDIAFCGNTVGQISIVYKWYDSAGNEDGEALIGDIKIEEVFGKATCYSDDDCPALVEKACNNRDACTLITKYKCENPGTTNSRCSVFSTDLTECKPCPETCAGGICATSVQPTCSSNSDCPPIQSPPFCYEDDSCVMVTNFICQNSKCVPAGGGAVCTECPNGCSNGACSETPFCDSNDDCPSIERRFCDADGSACVETIGYECQNSQCVSTVGSVGCTPPCPNGCENGVCLSGEEECYQYLEEGEHFQLNDGSYIMVWDIHYEDKSGNIDSVDFTLSSDLNKGNVMRGNSIVMPLNGNTYKITPVYISDSTTRICVSINGGPEENCEQELKEEEFPRTAILSDGSSISIWDIHYEDKSGNIDSVDFVLMSDMNKANVLRDETVELSMKNKKYVIGPTHIFPDQTTLCVSIFPLVEPKPCTPRYYCETEPLICPSNGIQIKECRDVECGESGYTEEVKCNPGECAGCEFEGRCIPYGFRIQTTAKEGREYNLYCDIDRALREQKTKLADGSWASCQNNYECESNVCSGGICIEVKDMIRQANLATRILCRLAHLFSRDNYNRCIYNFLGE